MPTGARHVPFNSRRTVHTVSQPPKIYMPIRIVLGSWHIQIIMQQRHNVAYAYRAWVAAFNVVNKKINAFVPIELGSQQNAVHAYRAQVVAFSIQRNVGIERTKSTITKNLRLSSSGCGLKYEAKNTRLLSSSRGLKQQVGASSGGRQWSHNLNSDAG